MRSFSWNRSVLVASLAFAATAAACSTETNDENLLTPAPTSEAPDGGPTFATTPEITSIEVLPSTATLDVQDGVANALDLQAIAHYKDGSSGSVTKGAKWSTTKPSLGSIDAGHYQANGSLGGSVVVTASLNGQKATAQVNVKLHLVQGTADPAVKTALGSATAADGAVTWAYPYDGTVFPRGLGGPTLMWNGGASADLYSVHIDGPTFELQAYGTAAPPARFAIPATTWQRLTDSSEGALDVAVTRWNGSQATRIAHHTWSIAAQATSGTIYYWANNLGRVMRIKPGATAPDDFANKPPLNDATQYPTSSCLMTCHTVSADGSVLASGGGSFGGTYDLRSGSVKKSLGGVWKQGETDGVNVEWMNSALSPDGKYVLVNAMAVGISRAVNGPVGFQGLYDTATGAKIPNSGLDGFMAMPAFSPEGSRVAYVASGDPAGWGAWGNPPPGGLHVTDVDLHASPMAKADREVVPAGADPNARIAWPSVSPDGQWVVYQRGTSADTRAGNADLYLASSTAPGQEVRLAKLDGDSYPFAAGARDASWNFEPTFAPVASGGYFWVVFTSRRTYGNLLTGDKEHTKQLWVAAIDQSPKPGSDPSHPPFRLDGQALDSLNMRGFWALEPCRGDGQSCSAGTECCGGYCSAEGDGGAPVCRSKADCAEDGDRCQTTSDCCGAASGVTCINHVCSAPTPR